jgi:hypothetical protein
MKHMARPTQANAHATTNPLTAKNARVADCGADLAA